MNESCPEHKQPFKWVPAGVAKTTGRPYPGFWACPERGCKFKPTETAAPKQEYKEVKIPDNRDFMWEGHVKGLNNLAGSMLAGGKSPAEVLAALPELVKIVIQIDDKAPKADGKGENDLPF